VGMGSDYIYYDYADGFQDPVASYGEVNVRFMREVARRYDPGGVFQTALEGGFKIPGLRGEEVVGVEGSGRQEQLLKDEL